MFEERWSTVGVEDILLRAWDGETVVYDMRDGNTHYLDPFAASLFDELRARPCTIAELTATHDEPDDDLLVATVAETLERFEAMRLVQRRAV